MAPPTKRRRPNVASAAGDALEVDDDVDSPPANATKRRPAPQSQKSPARRPSTLSQTQLTPTKTQTQLRPTRSPASRAGSQSASSSPEKGRASKARHKDAGIGKHADLFTLFSNQAQRPKAPKSIQNGASSAATNDRRSAGTPAPDVDDDDDDLIEDIDDEDVAKPKALASSVVGAAARKRGRDLMMTREVTSSASSTPTDTRSSSHKFLKTAMATAASRGGLLRGEDTRPWAERFGPASLDELAVHKKKVADVRGWLEAALDGRIRQRLLVLKGAAGTGKTATVQLLCQALSCEVLEWRNPVGAVGSADGAVSMAAQFDDFIGRGRAFGQLDLWSDAEATPDVTPSQRSRSIILVEEFPNTFTRSSSALQSFRSALMQYVESSASTREPVTPIVLIVSETLLTTMSASADSFTAHRLLGPTILQHPGVAALEFNPIAPTFITKALELVVLKESRRTGRRRTPGPQVLKRLGEVGDIRSAVGALEFLCLRGDADGDWGGRVLFTKPKRGAKGEVALTMMERESLELVTRREASLGIFHAVGKVVYNKRDDAPPPPPPGDEPDPEDLPPYLAAQARLRRSQVAIDDLIDETGTDTQTFIAALHENVLLSCEAPRGAATSTLDHVNGCIDALSDADLLTPAWDGSFNATGFGGGTGGRGSGGDLLRQDEMCFQIATRGLLFALPNPVRRQAVPGGSSRSADAFKIFYPTSMRLWRLQEPVDAALAAWTSPQLLHHRDDAPSAPRHTAAARPHGVVASWNRTARSLSSSSSPSTSGARASSPPPPPTSAAPVVILGSCARPELLLDRLPYQHQITAAGRARPASSARQRRALERIVVFRGLDGADGRHADGDDDDDDDAEGASRAMAGQWATDRPVETDSPRKRSRGGATTTTNGGGREAAFLDREAHELESKLVLSDDDIEDD